MQRTADQRPNQVEEAVGELNRFVDGFDANPERQQWVDERLDGIYSLARKHRVNPEELNSLHQQLLQELEGLQGEDGQLGNLAIELEQLAAEYTKKAASLTSKRAAAAKKLQKAVTERMQELGMPGGRFEIALTGLAVSDPAVHGLESIEFLVSANPGQPLKPLARVASGGELSRISLAIQVITAQTSRVPTLVFDEVDVGIGGPTAEIVGRCCASWVKLAKSSQSLTCPRSQPRGTSTCLSTRSAAKTAPRLLSVSSSRHSVPKKSPACWAG